MTGLTISCAMIRPTLQAVVEQLSEFKDAMPAHQSGAAAALDIERWLTCPLSLELMEDPVIAEDGNTYERAIIEQHLCRRAVSPMTNLPMGTNLFPNQLAKSMTKEW